MTTAPREYRVDPDNPDRVVSYSGTTASDGTRLWNDPWNAVYLGDEDVEGWTRLIPTPPETHECDFPPGITASETRRYDCPDCGTPWIKLTWMIGRKPLRGWRRMPDHLVQAEARARQEERRG